MKRILFISALAAYAAVAQAGITLTIMEPHLYIDKPESGFVLARFFGTVITSGGFAPSGAVVESPGNGSADLAFDHFDPGFLAYIATGSPATSYAGNLFFIRVAATDQTGLYDLNNAGTSPLSEVSVTAVSGGQIVKDDKTFSVNVDSVPEPVSLGILAVGATGLLLRRKK